MSLGTILLIVLIVLLIGAAPTWPYSSAWGYGPSGLLGIVLVVVLILLLLGRIERKRMAHAQCGQGLKALVRGLRDSFSAAA